MYPFHITFTKGTGLHYAQIILKSVNNLITNLTDCNVSENVGTFQEPIYSRTALNIEHFQCTACQQIVVEVML